MANKIKLKRGLSTNVSSLQLETGELAVTTDTGELYVGDKDKKVLKINENTTYTLTKSGSTITLKGSDGSTQTVSDSNTTYSAATQSANGLMSSTDKTKLDGIATGANNYSLPTASSSTLGGVKVGTNLSISNGVLSATDTKYDAATTSAAGLMSANDKTKLNGIATGATANTASTTSPKAAGTAAVGSETNYARGDHVHPAQTTITGNAGTATKLATARTIAIGTGASGTATSFDGSGNITIPITSMKEAYLNWGGQARSGSISPVDAGCSDIHSANKFQFALPAGITIQYSRDGGNTWTDYGATDEQKVKLVSNIGNTFYIGGRSSNTTINDKLRIILNATNMGVYTSLQKLLINISTNFATGSKVLVERAMKGSTTTYTTMGTYDLSGWPGWNSIPIAYAFGGRTDQTENIDSLRLTFSITGVNSDTTKNSALSVIDIIAIGMTNWSNPSTMSRTGHLYSFDYQKNATFPKNVNATSFSGEGANLTALNAGNISSGTLSADRLATSGVTAGSYGPTANVTGSDGATISVPQITVDAKGRVTSITNRTYTSKDSNTTYSNAGLGNGYGTCSTEAATVAKTVALSSYALSTQGRVSVKFDENVPAAATLNINSKGAKAIYYKGAAITEGIILGGDIVTFVYNGTQYEIVNIYREDEDIDQEYFGGSHISIDGNIISVSDLGDYKDLLTTNKDTMVNAINELVGVDQALIGDINTVQTNLDTNVSNLQAQINNFANTGAVANAVSNSLVQIDGSKVEIGTTSSKLQVKGDGETFKLQSGSNAILEADSNKVSTLALSVSGSLNTGYHQLKKFTRGSEQRTGLFWIGEE